MSYSYIPVECPQLLASPNENRASNRQFSVDHEAITQCITAFIVQLETAMATMTTTTTTTTTTTSRDEFLESCAADQGLGTVTFAVWIKCPGFLSVQIYVSKTPQISGSKYFQVISKKTGPNRNTMQTYSLFFASNERVKTVIN